MDKATLGVAVPPTLAGEVVVDCLGRHYREVNHELRGLVEQGVESLRLINVAGQRYLGTNLQRPVRITIEGVPGNDLGAFMDGPRIQVLGDAQDGCGNTMNSGVLAIHGSAGDIIGHSMRGGSIYIRDNVGYRVGIHMKEYGAAQPVIVIGGTAQHFLGEYMAGGVLIVLGRRLPLDREHPSRYIGAGMHGGVIYIAGKVNEAFLGKEVGMLPLSDADRAVLQKHVGEYARAFGLEAEPLLARPFAKLYPKTVRPYGRLYAY
jgi:glutamate synthase domain-containing protein 3